MNPMNYHRKFSPFTDYQWHIQVFIRFFYNDSRMLDVSRVFIDIKHNITRKYIT